MARARGTAAADAKNSKPTPAHPPYFQMVCEALTALKDRTGSSQPAIVKFIQHKYSDSLPANFRKHLSTQLKNCVDSDRLVKVKNSFKIAAPAKSEKAAKVSPAPAAKAKAKLKATASPKRMAARKVAARAEKMKRLSQVKTPEALKQKKTTKKSDAAKERKAAAPVKRKSSGSAAGPAAKKAKK